MVLPPTGAPPGFDVNVVSGRVSSCFSKEPNANSVRVNQFDEVLNLSRVEIYKVGLHEGIRLWPLGRVKLLKPYGQTFDEADPGNKVTVSVVLESGH